MKKLLVATALSLIATSALAGTLADPIVEPEIIVEQSSSSSEAFIVPLIFLLLIGFTLWGGDEPVDSVTPLQ